MCGIGSLAYQPWHSCCCLVYCFRDTAIRNTRFLEKPTIWIAPSSLRTLQDTFVIFICGFSWATEYLGEDIGCFAKCLYVHDDNDRDQRLAGFWPEAVQGRNDAAVLCFLVFSAQRNRFIWFDLMKPIYVFRYLGRGAFSFYILLGYMLSNTAAGLRIACLSLFLLVNAISIGYYYRFPPKHSLRSAAVFLRSKDIEMTRF